MTSEPAVGPSTGTRLLLGNPIIEADLVRAFLTGRNESTVAEGGRMQSVNRARLGERKTRCRPRPHAARPAGAGLCQSGCRASPRRARRRDGPGCSTFAAYRPPAAARLRGVWGGLEDLAEASCAILCAAVLRNSCKRAEPVFSTARISP